MDDDELRRILEEFDEEERRMRKEAKEDDETFVMFCAGAYAMLLPFMVAMIWLVPVPVWALLVVVLYGPLFAIVNMYDFFRNGSRSDDHNP